MIKITADSTCDLTPEILARYRITLAPLYVLVDDHTFRDGVDITPREIFQHAESGKKTRTAAVNEYDYAELFESFAKTHEAVIHIAISAHFSACYNNACLAAAHFDNVYVVDSRNLSSGSGHAVMDAARMAEVGMPANAIVKTLKDLIPRVDASFVIESLDYLRRGGRCSGLEAVGAKLLHIKPCIEVINGEMKVGKKYRGSFEHALKHYVRDRLSKPDEIDPSRIFITHPACTPEICEMVRDEIKALIPFEEIIETRAGCTVSNHCGPATLGILFKRRHPKEGIMAL